VFRLHRSAPPEATRSAIPARSSIGALFMLLISLGTPAGARAQLVDPFFWMLDGAAYSSRVNGNKLYVGGQFQHVGPYTGGFVAIDSTSGTELAGWPRVNGGGPSAIVSDGAGGWYIAGGFTNVNGVRRTNLAHIRADRTLDAWDPEPDAVVYAIAKSGNVIYVAGRFQNVGGQARAGVAALDATTGAATAWNPTVGLPPSTYMLAMALRGNTVYLSGSFLTMGGQSRHHLAAVNATTGAVTGWNPGVGGSPAVAFALFAADSVVYAGGLFSSAGGQPRANIAALDTSNGNATSWNPGTDDFVQTIAARGRNVYIGGNFQHAGGVPRSYVAAIDAGTGVTTPWNPAPFSTQLNSPGSPYDGLIYALALSGGQVYVGGDFTDIGGQKRSGVAAVDTTLGLASSWDPELNSYVVAIAVTGGTVYAGGGFSSAGMLPRNCLAEFDLTTGAATTWNPGADSTVRSLQVLGSAVYAGGDFALLGGQPRSFVGAVDTTSALATAWNPGTDGEVDAMTINGVSILIGGGFTHVGGVSHPYVASFDATGALRTWDPAVSGGPVLAMAESGRRLYLGGSFRFVSSVARNFLAEVDAGTAALQTWNPSASNEVDALLLNGNTVYAGGKFGSIDLQTLNGIGAIDATSGSPIAWDPLASGTGTAYEPAGAFAVADSTVYVGGLFTGIGGQPRVSVAALNANTAAATSWNAGLESAYTEPVQTLALAGNSVLFGGIGFSVDSLSVRGLVRMLPADLIAPSASVVSPNGGEVLDIGNTATLSWTASDNFGVQSVDLYISRTGALGPWELIEAGALNSGAYPWTVIGPASPGSCYIRVDARDWAGNVTSAFSAEPFTVAPASSGVSPGSSVAFALAPPAPNPAEGRALVSFELPYRTRARLSLFDIQGREVAVFADGMREAGRCAMSVDLRARRPGLYFLRLQADRAELRQKLFVLR
jgi:trimeric autotransporter adhesin